MLMEMANTKKINYHQANGNFTLSVYHTRPEANAVVHNHSIHCAGLSILEKPIPAIHYMVAVSGTDHIPCVPYATFGSHELASYVATGIKESQSHFTSTPWFNHLRRKPR